MHTLCHLASRHVTHWSCYTDTRSNQGTLDGMWDSKGDNEAILLCHVLELLTRLSWQVDLNNGVA